MFGDEKQLNETENGDAGSESETIESATPEATQELDALREAKEWRDKYLRQLADFDNFRKRLKLEQSNLREFVAESFIVSLLPVMDDFDRMLSSTSADGETLRKGVELIRNKLKTFFESQNVKEMDARGKPFDPEEHDAIMMTPTKNFPAGTVLDVVTPGYIMGDRVIRHAQVIVSTESKEESNS